jgi:hypothetical protein
MTSEVRDELVRAVMPELRVLTERLVNTTVERAIASLLDRQRELEAKLEHSGRSSFDKPHDFEAKIAAAIAPLLAKQSELERMLGTSRPNVPELPTSTARPPVEAQVTAPRARPPPLPLQAVALPPSAPSAVDRPAGPHPEALATAAFSANALVDIPAELNGSRRKRVAVFLLVVVLVGILATVVTLSVMSNMGAYP